MEKALLVATGGAAGCLARWAVSEWLKGATSHFPWPTFTVNVAGSLLIGVLMAAAEDARGLSDNFRLLLVVGVLGGFTTYSAFAYETWRLITSGRVVIAAAYAAGTTVACVVAAAVGARLSHALTS
jgi:fluoride exporter